MNSKLELLKFAMKFYEQNKEVIAEKIVELKDKVDVESFLKNIGVDFDIDFDKFKPESKTTEKTEVYELTRFYGGLYMEVPGFSKENVDINLDKKTNIITVKGKFTLMLSQNESKYKNFEVTYALDKDEVIDRVSLENGLLTIFLKAVEKEITKITID